jgi:hypothetical protein
MEPAAVDLCRLVPTSIKARAGSAWLGSSVGCDMQVVEVGQPGGGGAEPAGRVGAPTQRSAYAFAPGAFGGVRSTSMPPANTASNPAVNFVSRSRTR